MLHIKSCNNNNIYVDEWGASYNTNAFRTCGLTVLSGMINKYQTLEEWDTQFKQFLTKDISKHNEFEEKWWWWTEAGHFIWAVPEQYATIYAKPNSDNKYTLSGYLMQHPGTKLIHEYKNRAHGSGANIQIYVNHDLGKIDAKRTA